MKVGDLVRFKNSDLVMGIIVDMDADRAAREEGWRRWKDYVGIAWMDGDRIDFEPKHFLEVISEGR